MKSIKKVCVAGAGNMGKQIALNTALAGFEVSVITSKPEANAEWCRTFMEKGVTKGKYSGEARDETLSRVTFYTSAGDAVGDCDLVIESIIEDEALKRGFFIEANQYAKPDTIITSNSSYIPSSTFAGIITNPGRLANLHYFNPVMSMKLVEIVVGPHTDRETIESLKNFVEITGKQSIIVHKEIEGFVVNRLLRAVQDEAYFLYGSGVASFEDIDIAAEKGLNYPMGPFRLVDFTGIDINYFNRQRKFEQTGKEDDRPPAFLAEKYEKGEYGKKTGKGLYTYD